jgi:hypothetical protein
LTVTVWEHWTSSVLLGEPCSAWVPECTGEEATDAVPVQVHGDSDPVSKPPLTIAPLPGGGEDELDDGGVLGEDELDGGVVGVELLLDGGGAEELLDVPHDPLSVQTPCELFPGMSPWVHHFAVHWCPP